MAINLFTEFYLPLSKTLTIQKILLTLPALTVLVFYWLNVLLSLLSLGGGEICQCCYEEIAVHWLSSC
jgi:hypothetical protein